MQAFPHRENFSKSIYLLTIIYINIPITITSRSDPNHHYNDHPNRDIITTITFLITYHFPHYVRLGYHEPPDPKPLVCHAKCACMLTQKLIVALSKPHKKWKKNGSTLINKPLRYRFLLVLVGSRARSGRSAGRGGWLAGIPGFALFPSFRSSVFLFSLFFFLP